VGEYNLLFIKYLEKKKET
jgi:hypothetical protein